MLYKEPSWPNSPPQLLQRLKEHLAAHNPNDSNPSAPSERSESSPSRGEEHSNSNAGESPVSQLSSETDNGTRRCTLATKADLLTAALQTPVVLHSQPVGLPILIRHRNVHGITSRSRHTHSIPTVTALLAPSLVATAIAPQPINPHGHRIHSHHRDCG